MKYGKKYLDTLNSPGIPEEWRKQAIEYRQLKKVINRVASELESLGLTSAVLKDLLAAEDATPLASAAAAGANGSATKGKTRRRSNTIRELDPDEKHDGEVGTVEQVVDWESSEEEEDPALAGLSETARGKQRSRSKRRARASYELAGTSANPEPRIRIIFDSASSGTVSESSDSSLLGTGRVGSSSTESGSASKSGSVGRFEELPNSSEDDSVGGGNGSESSGTRDDDDEIEGDFENAGPQTNSLLKKMYGRSEEVEKEEEVHDWSKVGIDVEPSGRRKSDETVRHEVWREQAKAEERGSAQRDVENEADQADDETEGDRPAKARRHRHRQHRKEVFIPLNTDNEFLTLLAKALASLAALQNAQKQQFTAAVEILAREVSQVSSPSRPKSDLYIWREIFSLWVEAQIFESSRERDRGERSTEDVEAKLNWFVDQVAKRKLAKRMKHKESRSALENFIELNVQLLEMKKFQLANEEAARKILKKHDKRTALTASLGFPQFIAAASDLSASSYTGSGSSPNSRVLILPGFPSLPHVLLSTFTTTLLPIIPQLEDYECAICGEVAFKPIKLECGHKFCVRCLVKMQKRGQDGCPQCRSPVVLRANATNLDTTMQSFLELWFPKEVKLKSKANKKEAAEEELKEMGMEQHKCVVQ